MTDENRTQLGIDWPTVIAGALAAVTVAVLLSTLGAGGTLLGAAIGSVVATISTALYRQGIDTSRRKVASLQTTALVKVGVAQQEVRRAAHATDSPTAGAGLALAERRLDEAMAELESTQAEPDVPGTRELEAVEPTGARRWAALPWKRIALLALTLFIAALLLISAFEALTGRTVSSYTGGTEGDPGTSFGTIVEDTTDQGDDTGDDRDEGRTDQPQHRDDDPTPAPSEDATTPAPSEEVTPSEEPTPTEESTEPTEQPTTESPTSEAPTETSTPTPSPTATP